MKLSLKKILIVASVALTFGIAWIFYKKYKEAKKLKVGDISLVPEKKIKSFNDLLDIAREGLKLSGTVSIRNFSGKDFTLNQVSLDTYSPVEEKLLTEQTNILQNDITLVNKQVSNIPLEYDVDVLNTLSLFKESQVIPQDYTVWKILSNPVQAYKDIALKNLKIKLKGFIQAEGLTIPIDETINLYD